MQKLLVFQSLWAMERRHTDGLERSLDENVAMIAAAGFDGISAQYTNRRDVERLNESLQGTGLKIEGVCFPRSVEDLRLPLELAAAFPVSHINLQPDIRPRRIEDCLPLLADLSHFLVGREFAFPVQEENHALIRRILQNAHAFHGRVASREQVQLEISFPHHRPWLDLFLEWWDHGFRAWRSRAGRDAELVFTCELGPRPYAITGRDGNDTTDRWEEALLLRQLVRDLWAATAQPRR